MNDFGFVVMACAFAVMLLMFGLVEWRRTAAIRAIASRSGFHYLGEALPRSLRLEGTPFDRASRVWNVIDGEPHGVRLIAFDCRVGIGKQSWRRTVIAVESGGNPFPQMLHPGMNIDTSGSWKILYRPKAFFAISIPALMPLQELESYLNGITRDTAKISSFIASESNQP
jgi:hypothetical protein